MSEKFDALFALIGGISAAVISWFGFGAKAGKALSIASAVRDDYDKHVRDMEKRSEQFYKMQADVQILKQQHVDLKIKVEQGLSNDDRILEAIKNLAKKD